jgi:hypothetical protein
MTSVWMGLSTAQKEIDAGHIELIGDKTVAHSMQQWLGMSPFAKERTASRSDSRWQVRAGGPTTAPIAAPAPEASIEPRPGATIASGCRG